jgi:hypothetical protein
MEIIVVYCENPIESMDTSCGQNEELLDVEASGTKCYHWDLRG